MCPLALATYTLEANRFAGTLVVTECRQKLFHNLFFTVYRDLDADKVKESLKDVRHVFMQAAGETPAMERWLNRCIGAGQSGDKYRIDGYSYYCAADEDTYLFTMSAEEEHDHPPVKVAKKPKCMTQKAYEDMIRRRLLERARFAGRMDDYYLLYPEDRPQRIVDPAERYRSGYLRSKEAARERGDLIVVSPFVRTRQTAEPLRQKYPDVPVEEWPVQEFSFLDADRCADTTQEERRPLAEAYFARNDPDYVDGKDAESFNQLLARVDDMLTRLRALPGENKTVVFTHGNFMRAARLRPAAENTEIVDITSYL